MRQLHQTVVPAVLVLLLAPAGAVYGQTPAENGQMRRPPPRSWTADRREYQEGDVITVYIDERTLASADRTELATRDQRRQARAGAGVGAVDGLFGGFDGDAGFESDKSGESRERGQAVRRERFSTEISARVVAVEPGGVLRIEGRKTLQIDDHEQSVTLRGWVRPEDVSSRNSVESWRIGDAEIRYESNDRLGEPKLGILSRILGWLWP